MLFNDDLTAIQSCFKMHSAVDAFLKENFPEEYEKYCGNLILTVVNEGDTAGAYLVGQIEHFDEHSAVFKAKEVE